MRSVLETNPVMWVLSWFQLSICRPRDWMATVRAPALVIHGDRDSVIPVPSGAAPLRSAARPQALRHLPGGDHNDAVPPDAEAYWAPFDSSSRRCPRRVLLLHLDDDDFDRLFAAVQVAVLLACRIGPSQ